MPLDRRKLIVAIWLATTAAIAGCGDEAKQADPSPGSAAIGHVHGIDVDPEDNAVYVATHSGLLFARAGKRELVPVGRSRQDIMGFSIAGRGRFIGSGHPDPRDAGMPDHLGLIESRDRGRSWIARSQYGRADFHVLEAAGPRIYGFDGVSGQFLVSADGGQRWTAREAPAAVFSAAIDPGNPRHVVVATESGLYSTRNAARTWRLASADRTGLVAWPAEGRLHLLDARGTIAISLDAGRKWKPSGSIRGGPVALEAEGVALYVALEDGSVQQSSDGGATWKVRATPE